LWQKAGRPVCAAIRCCYMPFSSRKLSGLTIEKCFATFRLMINVQKYDASFKKKEGH